jgi:hypothetical protein
VCPKVHQYSGQTANRSGLFVQISVPGPGSSLWVRVPRAGLATYVNVRLVPSCRPGQRTLRSKRLTVWVRPRIALTWLWRLIAGTPFLPEGTRTDLCLRKAENDDVCSPAPVLLRDFSLRIPWGTRTQTPALAKIPCGSACVGLCGLPRTPLCPLLSHGWQNGMRSKRLTVWVRVPKGSLVFRSGCQSLQAMSSEQRSRSSRLFEYAYPNIHCCLCLLPFLPFRRFELACSNCSVPFLGTRTQTVHRCSGQTSAHSGLFVRSSVPGPAEFLWVRVPKGFARSCQVYFWPCRRCFRSTPTYPENDCACHCVTPTVPRMVIRFLSRTATI